MFKLWAKTIKNDRVKKSFVYKGEDKFEPKLFEKYMRELCEQMDIPTPVILKSHKRNFDSFNMTKFNEGDFVEHIDFDSLTVEYCRDDHGEKKHIYKAYLPTD